MKAEEMVILVENIRSAGHSSKKKIMLETYEFQILLTVIPSCLRPYQKKDNLSSYISKVKLDWDWLVVGWGTAL